MWRYGRDRIVVSTSRCGRDNPGSNPGHGRDAVDLWRGIATLIFPLSTLNFLSYKFTVNAGQNVDL